LDQLTSEQLSEWEAFDRLDPIGKWRDEFNFAVLDSLIVNIVSRLYAKKGHTPREVSPTEFMPNWSGEKKIAKRQSVEEMKQALFAIAKSVNKKLEKTPQKPKMTDGKKRVKKPVPKPPNRTKKQ
jgi:hypothetical protein